MQATVPIEAKLRALGVLAAHPGVFTIAVAPELRTMNRYAIPVMQSGGTGPAAGGSTDTGFEPFYAVGL